MKKIKMSVNGIMCNNCIKKINAAVSNAVGCESSNVSDDFSTVYVEYNENQTSTSQITDIIEGIKDKSFQVIKTEEDQ